MINYDSILSAFDGKPTLLQWLKMVKKALDESILKNVDITQNGEKVVFTFNFEDGTSISTPEVTLTKGDKGDKGDTGAAGPKGDNGVSITGINTVGNEVVGDETLTTLRANYSNNTTNDFVVTAKNGKDANYKNYLHCIRLYDSIGKSIYYTVTSKKNSLSFTEAISAIPTTNDSDITYLYINKIAVSFSTENGEVGTVSVAKQIVDNFIYIHYIGVSYDSSGNVIKCDGTIEPTLISDTIIGENL